MKNKKELELVTIIKRLYLVMFVGHPEELNVRFPWYMEVIEVFVAVILLLVIYPIVKLVIEPIGYVVWKIRKRLTQ